VGEQGQAARTREFLEATIRRDVAVAYRQYRAASEKLVFICDADIAARRSELQTVRAAYGLGEFSVFEVVAEQRRLNESVTGYNQLCAIITRLWRNLKRRSASRIRRRLFAPDFDIVLPGQRHRAAANRQRKVFKIIVREKDGMADVKTSIVPQNKNKQEKNETNF
jgi:hypothetical protein